MSDKPNNGEPAFPVSDLSKTQAPGMTLRDYFAAKAMAAMMHEVTDIDGYRVFVVQEERARLSYQQADAMLAAREVKP